ncbi:hypothetical protein CHCC14431_1320 [Bacillus licheniformis]|nr:hypothetical protein CHCC14431_1320 [Bacillus licheniformis]
MPVKRYEHLFSTEYLFLIPFLLEVNSCTLPHFKNLFT